MLHIQLIALGLTSTALAVSGCGGSSKTGSTTTVATTAQATTAATPAAVKSTVKVATGRPLTRSALIAKGDAICARANKKLGAITVTTQADFVRVLPQIAIYDSTEFSELGKLVPPASLVRDWGRIINASHLFSEYVNQVAINAQATKQVDALLIHTAEAAQGKMESIARHDGFKECTKAN
jgi:hypothetical protein